MTYVLLKCDYYRLVVLVVVVVVVVVVAVVLDVATRICFCCYDSVYDCCCQCRCHFP